MDFLTKAIPIVGVAFLLCSVLTNRGGAYAEGTGGYDVSWYTIDGGGGRSFGGPFSVSGTIGQPDVGRPSGGPYRVRGGFWPASGDTSSPGDCNGNGVPDLTDIAEGTSPDCNQDDIPDECTLADQSSEDCNDDVIPDECQIMRHYTGLGEAPDQWNDANNWLDLISPADGDHACIHCNDRTSVVAFNNGYRLLSSLASEIDFRIDGVGNPAPELELDGPSFIKGDLVMTGTAILRNNNDLKVRGVLHWSGGTMRGSGTTTVAGGLALTPLGNATNLRDSHHLLILGGLTTVNSKYMALSNTAQVTIGPDMAYTYNGNSNVFTGGLTTLVEVDGSLIRASGDGLTTISSPIDATGLIHNMTGELYMRQGGTHSGDVLSDPGTTLRLGGLHDFLPSSNLTAERLVLESASGSGAHVRGTVDIANSLECVGSQWVFTDEANILSYSPTLSVVESTLTLEAPTDRAVEFDQITIGPSAPGEPTANPTFDTGQPINTEVFGLYNGIVRGNSPINITDEFIWKDGSFQTGGDVTADGTMEIRDTNHSRSLQRTLRIAGNATMLAGLTVSGSSRIDILPSGTLDLIGATAISGGVINNAGVLRKSHADAQSSFTADINNTGTVELQVGVAHFQQMDYIQTAGQTLLNGGNIVSNIFGGLQINGGVLGGVGVADCDVRIDGGTMAPGVGVGGLSVGGDYMQTTAGALEIEVAGAGPGQFDILTVGGEADLGGDIEVRLLDGYVPPVGTMFTVLLADAVASQFDSIGLTGFPATLGIEVTYENESVTLEVVGTDTGDCDDDGDIDLFDYACFVDCAASPGPPVPPGCERFDFDHSGDIDLIDYGYFSVAFTGD